MIGMKPKRRGMFGAPIDYGTPGFNPDAQMSHMTTAMPQPTSQPEKVKPLGVVADFLSGMAGGPANYANGLQQRRMMETQAQQRMQQAHAARAAKREDFMFEHDYRRENPEAQAPDAFERAMAGAGIDPTSPDGQQMYKARAESMARDPNDEFVVVPIPNVGTYAGPKSGLGAAMGGGGQPQAPARPVGGLQPMGGGGGNVTSGFLGGF